MLSLREVNGNRVTRAYWGHADLSNSLPFQEKGKQSREFTTADDWIEMSWYFSTNSHGIVIRELAASLSPESLLKMQNLGLHSRPFESESEKHCFSKNDNGSHHKNSIHSLIFSGWWVNPYSLSTLLSLGLPIQAFNTFNCSTVPTLWNEHLLFVQHTFSFLFTAF